MGLIEAADRGTLFIDEINSLPMSVQSKLLRVIEEKSVQRIGAVTPKKVDFQADCRHQPGSPRPGAGWKISGRSLLPPPCDPPDHSAGAQPHGGHHSPVSLFLDFFCSKYNLNKSFSEEVLRQVQTYRWPGNVREIRNFVERILVMTPHSVTEIASIPEGMLEDDTSTTLQREVPLLPPHGKNRTPPRWKLAALKLFETTAPRWPSTWESPAVPSSIS